VGTGKLPFSDFLEMTILEAEIFIDGMMLQREAHLNDLLFASYDLARLIPLSVWSPDKLPKEPTRINSAQTKTGSAYSSKPRPTSASDLSEEERQRIIDSIASFHVQTVKELNSI